VVAATPAVPTVPALAPGNQAQVEVKLPADARLYIDGEAVSLDKGRVFQTPALEPGRQYYYTMKVEAVRDGETVSKTERVIVAAGRTVQADFTSLGGVAAKAAAPARVTVELPADARLFVDDVNCPLTSEKRSFETPKLQPGQKYAYTLRAEVVRDGKTLSKVRKVEMQAGGSVNVKFDDLDTLQAASR
jgi:uncharacterized protein (TIGR03000 family)